MGPRSAVHLAAKPLGYAVAGTDEGVPSLHVQRCFTQRLDFFRDGVFQVFDSLAGDG